MNRPRRWSPGGSRKSQMHARPDRDGPITVRATAITTASSERVRIARAWRWLRELLLLCSAVFKYAVSVQSFGEQLSRASLACAVAHLLQSLTSHSKFTACPAIPPRWFYVALHNAVTSTPKHCCCHARSHVGQAHTVHPSDTPVSMLN